MHGEIGELASVPCPDPFPGKGRGCEDFVIDIKTVARGTEIGADAAFNTAHRGFIPERGLKHNFKLWRNGFDILNLPGHLFFRFRMYAVFLFLVSFLRSEEERSRQFAQLIALFRQGIHVVFIAHFGHQDIQAVR